MINITILRKNKERPARKDEETSLLWSADTRRDKRMTGVFLEQIAV